MSGGSEFHGVRLFSARTMVHAATAELYDPAQRAAGLGGRGEGRFGPVVGPSPPSLPVMTNGLPGPGGSGRP
ncbi:hypothetical protein ACIPSE_13465 [Streptomyces sp. NPDC090106]|uniref:hypothetical protein n=1 Tax=Streptomyces sp. NPDC090106 TaxID=3365946 RepID=UPI00380C1056